MVHSDHFNVSKVSICENFHTNLTFFLVISDKGDKNLDKSAKPATILLITAIFSGSVAIPEGELDVQDI